MTLAVIGEPNKTPRCAEEGQTVMKIYEYWNKYGRQIGYVSGELSTANPARFFNKAPDDDLAS